MDEIYRHCRSPLYHVFRLDLSHVRAVISRYQALVPHPLDRSSFMYIIVGRLSIGACWSMKTQGHFDN